MGLQSAVTALLELDFKKNGFHIVIPGTAPCEADNRFLFVALGRAVAMPTASHLSDTHFFIQSTRTRRFTALSLD